MRNLDILEKTRAYARAMRIDGPARIYPAKGYFDAYAVTRNRPELYVIQYGFGVEIRYVLVGATPPKRLRGMLVSTVGDLDLSPYSLTGGRYLIPMRSHTKRHNTPIIFGTVVMGQLNVETDKQIPLVPQKPPSDVQELLNIAGYQIFACKSDCPYSGTIAGERWETPACPVCSGTETIKSEARASVSEVENAHIKLREMGVL